MKVLLCAPARFRTQWPAHARPTIPHHPHAPDIAQLAAAASMPHLAKQLAASGWPASTPTCPAGNLLPVRTMPPSRQASWGEPPGSAGHCGGRARREEPACEGTAQGQVGWQGLTRD